MKLYAWEIPVSKVVYEHREKELAVILKFFLIFAFGVFLIQKYQLANPVRIEFIKLFHSENI